MDSIEVLRRSDVFHYLKEDDLKIIAGMCTTEEFEPGKIIFRHGQEAEKIYVIEEGLVSILIEPGPRDRRQIQTASNFQCFGWAAMIPPYWHLRTVQTIEMTKVYSFKGKELCALVETEPKLFASIIVGVAYVISQRLKVAFDQLMGSTYQD